MCNLSCHQIEHQIAITMVRLMTYQVFKIDNRVLSHCGWVWQYPLLYNGQASAETDQVTNKRHNNHHPAHCGLVTGYFPTLSVTMAKHQTIVVLFWHKKIINLSSFLFSHIIKHPKSHLDVNKFWNFDTLLCCWRNS